jgi:hypothetical protein
VTDYLRRLRCPWSYRLGPKEHECPSVLIEGRGEIRASHVAWLPRKKTAQPLEHGDLPVAYIVKGGTDSQLLLLYQLGQNR